MPKPINRLSSWSRWAANDEGAERARMELSALWFLRRIGFNYEPFMLGIQSRAQQALREAEARRRPL